VRPSAIFARLEAIVSLDAPPQRLRNLIEHELAHHFRLPALRAAEMAERLEGAVAQLIERKQLQSEQLGTLATMALVGSAADTVVGSCHARSSDAPEIARAKARRINTSPLLARIQALSPTEFEVFGAKVLGELGAQKVRVTRQSNDQGIDFYGVLNVGELLKVPAPFFRLSHDLEIRFAGQAKHYPKHAVGTDVVRELIGAISLARFKTYSTETDLFEDFELKPLNPLVAMLFTTGSLSSGAVELAGKAGIIARSGLQLAAFLADCGVGMRSDANGVTFDAEAFSAWLAL